MHSTEFEQHLLNFTPSQPTSRDCNVRIHAVAFDLRGIHAASFKPLHPLSRTSTSSYLRHCNPAAASGRRYAKEAEGPTRWSHDEGQHGDLRQLQ